MYDRNKQSGLVSNKYYKSKSLLPSEYKEVEYLESTGVQYLNLGMILNTTDQLTIYFDIYHELTSAYGEQWFFGTRACEAGCYPAGTFWTGHFTYGATGLNRYHVRNSGNHTDTNYSAYFMARNWDGTASSLSRGKWYNLIIMWDTTLKMNLIPCYRISDNVAGMYDTVSKQFFINQGTGADFILGPEV